MAEDRANNPARRPNLNAGLHPLFAGILNAHARIPKYDEPTVKEQNKIEDGFARAEMEEGK